MFMDTMKSKPLLFTSLETKALAFSPSDVLFVKRHQPQITVMKITLIDAYVKYLGNI